MLAASLVNFIYFRSKNAPKAPFKVKRKFLVYSLFGYFFYWLFFLLSIEYYGEMIAPPIILNYTWPFFTGLITMLFFTHKQPKPIFYITLLLGFLGVMVLASEGSIENLQFSYSILGLLFGLLTGCSFGIFSAFSSTIKTEQENSIYLLTGTTISCVLLAMVSYWKYGANMFDLSTRDWLLAIFIGACLDSFGYILWTRAQAIVKAENLDLAGILNLVYFLPIFSIALIAILFEGERNLIGQPYFIVATLLIVSSSIILRLSER